MPGPIDVNLPVQENRTTDPEGQCGRRVSLEIQVPGWDCAGSEWHNCSLEVEFPRHQTDSTTLILRRNSDFISFPLDILPAGNKVLTATQCQGKHTFTSASGDSLVIENLLIQAEVPAREGETKNLTDITQVCASSSTPLLKDAAFITGLVLMACAVSAISFLAYHCYQGRERSKSGYSTIQ